MPIDSLGWSSTLGYLCEQAKLRLPSLSLVPGRVVRVDGPWVRVRSETGERLARPAGRLRDAVPAAADLPTVGDWVLLEEHEHEGEVLVHAVLERRSLLARRRPGARLEEQALAANVDVVLLVSPLDRELNERRLEREVTLAYDSGASPAVLLTKADLVGAEVARAATVRLERAFLGTPVVVISAFVGEGLEAVRALLPPCTTGALLGPSGSGKSTLVNALLGEERMATSNVSEEDARGRHTTTHRELLTLSHGGLLIDGPGLREVGLTVDDDSLQDVFADVSAFAEQCRFRDCMHRAEPGCAVRAAIDSGALDEGRLASFEKLRREAAFARSKLDDSAARERKAHGKKMSGLVDEALRRKGRR